MSSIRPPERTSASASLLVVVQLTLFTLVFHLPGARPWLMAAIALLTATAVRLRQAPAIHCGLLALLVIPAFTTPALKAAWPLSGLLAVGVYAAIVQRVTLLKTSSGWTRKGRPTRADLALSVALGALSFLAILAWARLARPDLSARVTAVPDVTMWIAVTAVVFAVVNPLVEEAIFRGVFMYALEAALGTRAALVLQAVFFGLLHIEGLPSGPWGMPLAGAVGLALGLLRLKTRGMLAPWLAHAVANGLMYLYLVQP